MGYPHVLRAEAPGAAALGKLSGRSLNIAVNSGSTKLFKFVGQIVTVIEHLNMTRYKQLSRDNLRKVAHLS